MVPLSREAREALLSRARFRAFYCPASPWVLCRRDGSRIAKVSKSFNAAVTAAGLDNVHPHDLRRTFGNGLVRAGVGIERVSELLRHSDVAITARVYAHLRPRDLAAAVEVLDGPGDPVSRSSFTRADQPVQEENTPSPTVGNIRETCSW